MFALLVSRSRNRDQRRSYLCTIRTDRIDRLGAQGYQRVASFEKQKIRVSFGTSMLDRREQLRIQTPDACQKLCIDAVVLAISLGDQTDVTRVGHDHLMTELLQETTHPRRLASRFDDHRRFALKSCEHTTDL